MNEHRRHEPGFTVVEVVIAALLLAFVIVGATMMFSSTQRSGSSTKVRDKQTALANQVLAQLQANPQWAPWCRTQQNPNSCDLTSWMQQNGFQNIGVVKDGSDTLNFNVKVVALGVDLPADKQGSLDEDGLVPDIYRLRVSIAADAQLTKRSGDLAPFVVQSDVNPSLRVESGQVVIDVCIAQNQIDERIAIGDCTGGSNSVDLLPPPSLNTTSASTIKSTCDGPNSSIIGADDRDCAAFKCADVEIGNMGTQGLKTPCSSYPGWTPPNPNKLLDFFLTKIGVAPGQGNVRLKNVKTGQFTPVKQLVNGRATFDQLKVGMYDVVVNVQGSSRLWMSKSVPSTQRVAVEPGLKSRAVLMYRPDATGSVSVPVRSTDGSIPWATRVWNNWTTIDNWGNVQNNGSQVMCLVPAPQGRLLKSDIACERFQVGVASFDFNNVEPGLYAAMISDERYYSFKSLSGTAGFFWVPEGGGAIVKLNNSTAKFEWVNGMCAKFVREAHIGETNPPAYTTPLVACNTGSGPGGVGGGSGGGTT